MTVSDLSSLQPQFIDVPGRGRYLLPREFALFTGEIEAAEVHDAQESPERLHAQLAAGLAIVLTGPYSYVNGIFRYCQHFERGLVESGKFSHIAHPGQRSAGVVLNGLVGVYSPKLTREAVWEAFRKRQVYGTSGPKIILNFRVADSPIGSEVRSMRVLPASA